MRGKFLVAYRVTDKTLLILKERRRSGRVVDGGGGGGGAEDGEEIGDEEEGGGVAVKEFAGGLEEVTKVVGVVAFAA